MVMRAYPHHPYEFLIDVQQGRGLGNLIIAIWKLPIWSIGETQAAPMSTRSQAVRKTDCVAPRCRNVPVHHNSLGTAGA